MIDSKESMRHQVWYGGIAAGSFITVVQMLGRGKLNSGHRTALACFAMALPVAVTLVVWPPKYPLKRLPEKIQKRIRRAGFLATLVFAAGMIALFSSFGAIFGVILFVATGIVAGLGNSATGSIKKQND
jgi:cobalamin synthase